MTGKTYEERVKAAQRFNIGRFLKRVLRLNKAAPIYYANSNRGGLVEVNPALIKEKEQKA